MFTGPPIPIPVQAAEPANMQIKGRLSRGAHLRAGGFRRITGKPLRPPGAALLPGQKGHHTTRSQGKGKQNRQDEPQTTHNYYSTFPRPQKLISGAAS